MGSDDTTQQHVRRDVAAWVDGELSPEQAARVRAHVEQCADCDARVRSHRALKHAVARLEACDDPPEAVHARIHALAVEHRARGARTRRLAVMATAAAVVVGAAASVWSLSSSPSDGMADALVADHLRSVPEAKPVEVASDDPERIRRFFDQRVPFEPIAPAVPDSRLLGGRHCVIEGRSMELLFYEHDRRTLSLFVSDAAGEPEGCTESADHQVCRRRHGELTLTLVGRVPPDRMARLLDGARL